ncbi:MAG: DedA family protein [Bacteroidales bacterium]|jgi:membrane protein YqaA with SNARE-associated domain|nr:DedA family protein [Bacteroidales bacterium]
MSWLVRLGYLGLFMGTFLAGTVFPLSSDILFVGILSIKGNNPWLSLIIATLGNWLGCMLSYGVGWLGRWDWLEKWFKIKKEKLGRQKTVVDKYGVWMALFPWIPFVGTLSLIALGFYKVRPKMTTLLVLIGCFARFLLWTLLFVAYADKFVSRIMG